MSVDVSDPVTVSHSEQGNSGTHATPTCCCERPGCPGTTACYREFASTETGWRRIADRRPNWVLANGQAI